MRDRNRETDTETGKDRETQRVTDTETKRDRYRKT